MAFDEQLAARVRTHLKAIRGLRVEEKKMFGGLTFLVNGKMCVNVSGNRLMCRFDPVRYEELSRRAGFADMVMKGRKLKGYGYIVAEGFKSKAQFEFWLDVSLAFNEQAQSSRKK